ncbi:MAG: flagellin [Hyphomicrobiaceae bacterium]|nr:flagellin [Hyphomicrobiaceae bacterium]
MSSINTNIAANSALQALTQTQKGMIETQSRIATGYRVATAQDNAAYWSIATTMRSDNGALSTVKDALGLGSATADVAYTGINNGIKLLDQIKQKLVAAREPGVDRTKIQSDITALQAQLQSTADTASFSGQNWLKMDSTAGTDITKAIVSSFSRDSSNAVTVGTITVNLYTVATGDTTALYDANTTDSAKAGLLDKQQTATSGATYTIDSLDISALTDSDADLADLDSYISAVDSTISKMTTAATNFGSVKSRIDLQKTFVSDLMTTVDTGVGQLVDADMNEESTKLQALQTKQSLGIQSLSIANQSSQSILRLFQ